MQACAREANEHSKTNTQIAVKSSNTGKRRAASVELIRRVSSAKQKTMSNSGMEAREGGEAEYRDGRGCFSHDFIKSAVFQRI